MKQSFLIVILAFLSICSLSAQTITGKVVDEKNKQIENANIVLRTMDSTFVAGALTNKDGIFQLQVKEKSTEKYKLIVSSVGYQTYIIELNNLLDKTDVGSIMMQNVQLDEVIVTARHSITKTDRQLIYPTRNIIKKSTNGYDVLNKLMLPSLKVDVINKNISKMNGGNVPIYINDRKADKSDVISLRPDEIIRVEYIDAPGVQYADDDAEAVVHFIVKRRETGFVTGINTTNAITSGNGNNLYFYKYNHKLSEFGVNYSMNYGVVNDRYINQTDTYSMPDATSHIISRKGLSTHLQYVQHQLQLTYNLSVPQKYVFETNVRGIFYDSPDRGHRQYVSETGKSDYYSLTEPTEKYHSPILDVFYKRYLPKKQIISTNIVGTYINTEYGYNYKMYSDDKFSNNIKNYGYNTKGEKYSVIGEVRYSIQLENMSFLSGLKHFNAYTQNRYLGTQNIDNRIHNTSTYFYSQINGQWAKLNYIMGAGLSYQTYQQKEDNYTYWLLRPSLTLSYVPFSGANLRYRFYVTPQIPPISSMSNIKQQANDLEFRLGNPNLKPYWDMTNTIKFSYQQKRYYIENTLGYTYSEKPIMEEINRTTDYSGNTLFSFGYDNQKSRSQIWNYLSGRYFVIPNKFVVLGGVSYQIYNSNGNNYTHNHKRIGGLLQAELLLGNWSIGGKWNSQESSLSGETVSYGSDYSDLYVNYQYKNMTFGIDWSYIFKKTGSTNSEITKNMYVTKELNLFVPDWGNLVSLSFSWNLSKGRKYQSQSKNINNSDNESGIFKF